MTELVAAHPFAARTEPLSHVALMAGCAKNVTLPPRRDALRGGSQRGHVLSRSSRSRLDRGAPGRTRLRSSSRPSGRETWWAGAGSSLRTAGRLTRAYWKRWALSRSTARVCAPSVSRIRRSASPSCLEVTHELVRRLQSTRVRLLGPVRRLRVASALELRSAELCTDAGAVSRRGAPPRDRRRRHTSAGAARRRPPVLSIGPVQHVERARESVKSRVSVSGSPTDHWARFATRCVTSAR
jgi:hypothetical protein